MTQGRPTVYDVAAEAGVSIATVSRYFSNPDAVAARTRDRVSAAVTALGYVQNSAARRLAGGNNETIALCLPDFDEPDTPLNLSASDGTVATVRGEDAFGAGADGLFFGEIIRGVEVEARRLGVAVTIVIGRVGDPELDARLRRLMGRVDGVVAVAGSLSGPQVEMLARQMPVALTSDAGSEPGVDHVRTDNDAGMYAMTSHLLETHDVRRPVFLAGPEESPDSSVRFDAYRRSLGDHGVPVPQVPDLSGDFTRTAGRHMGVRLLSQGLSGQDDAPDAIVCANDQTALGVMDVLGSAGVRIPEDVAVTGYDGTVLAQYSQPPLTTVEQSMEALGRAAFVRLAARIADRHHEEGAADDAGDSATGERAVVGEQSVPSDNVLILPVRLLLRASCGCG